MVAGLKLGYADEIENRINFVDGLRVTDAATISIVEMVLLAALTRVMAAISLAGGRAVGVSGKDGGLITARN